MKKLFCVVILAVITTCLFTGCGNNNAESKMISDAGQVVTDAVDEAKNIVDGMTGGAVSDGDGIIGNEGKEDNDNTSSDNSDDVTENSDNTTLADDTM